MSHGTEQHLEHAEHAHHHAHDRFDRRVAVSMAVIAAILAGVTLASHRGHTETLRLATEGSTKHTVAADKWAEFQAKNIRSHEYQAFLFLQSMLTKEALKDDAQSIAMRDYWIKQVDKYEGAGYWAEKLEALKSGKEPADKVGSLAKLLHEAKDLEKEAGNLEHQSHALHDKVTWIDMGHLGLELALVFCALAMLRKRPQFWVVGITVGVIGAALAGFGMAGWMTLGQH
jgi:hypothetical protein